MKRNYKREKHNIALLKGISDIELDIIDRVQFEFVREVMKEDKHVRLPNFGIFILKPMYKNDKHTR